MTTANSKTNILQKLRDAQTNTSIIPTTESVYQWGAVQSPVEHFQALLIANHATVINIGETDVNQCVHDIIKNNNFRCAVASERVREQYPSLIETTDPLPIGRIETWKEFLFNDVDVGITSASCAIATTGTIVLRPGPDEPRSLSLVPPCHIVIVREETLYNDFAEIMHVQNWQSGMPTNIVLVSGPSKTADIQQTLAYGAHGPRDLFVLFIRNNAFAYNPKAFKKEPAA